MMDKVELIAKAVEARELPALDVQIFEETRKGYAYPGSTPVPDWTCITVNITFAEGEIEAEGMLSALILRRHASFGLPRRGDLMGKYHERITGKIVDLLGGDSKNRYTRLPTGEQLDVRVVSDSGGVHNEMNKFLDRAIKSSGFFTEVVRLADSPPSFEVLEELGLIFTSSPRQVKNKTHVYYDPKTDSYLRFYRNGTTVKLATYNSEWDNYKDERTLTYDRRLSVGLGKAYSIVSKRRKKVGTPAIRVGAPVAWITSYTDVVPLSEAEIKNIVPEGKKGWAHINGAGELCFGGSQIPVE